MLIDINHVNKGCLEFSIIKHISKWTGDQCGNCYFKVTRYLCY